MNDELFKFRSDTDNFWGVLMGVLKIKFIINTLIYIILISNKWLRRVKPPTTIEFIISVSYCFFKINYFLLFRRLNQTELRVYIIKNKITLYTQ